MSRSASTTIVLGSLAAALLVSTAPADGAVVYRESFDNATIAGLDPADFGWNLHRNDEAIENSFGSQWQVANGTGDTDTVSTGFLFRSGNGADYQGHHLYWTDEFSLNIGQSPLESVSWASRNASTDTIHVALKIDGSWYVSAQGYANAADALTFTPAELEIVEATVWNSLTLNPGVELSVGNIVTLPTSGMVQAFGLYSFKTTNKHHRLDSYTINAVPEPAMLGLASVGGLLMLRRRHA